MPSDQVLAEVRRRYIYKQVSVGSLGQLFTPRHICLFTPNTDNVAQFYHVLHAHLAFEPMTHVLLSATNADQAIERATRVRPDILLLDKFIPPNGGYDLYYRLEQVWREAMPPTLMIMPPGDNSPLQRPNYGLIYLYRGLFRPVAVLQGMSTILARVAATQQAVQTALPTAVPAPSPTPAPALAAAAAG